jgi:uncharacterized protein YceK
MKTWQRVRNLVMSLVIVLALMGCASSSDGTGGSGNGGVTSPTVGTSTDGIESVTNGPSTTLTPAP